MDWIQVFVLASSMIGSCWYFKRDSDIKFEKISDELKSYHGRMCTLEERYMQLMQKFWESK